MRSKRRKVEFEDSIMRIYTKDNLILLQTIKAVRKKPFNIEPDIKRLEYAKKFIAQT